MRHERLGALFLAGIFGIFSAVPPATKAQTTATLHGRLTDPAGAGIAGARLVAQPLDSSAKPVETSTGAEGKFSLTLSPGRYRVSATRESFESVEEELSLAAGESREWDARLSLAKLSATVVVTGSAQPSLADTTSALVDVISKEELDQRQEVSLLTVLSSQQGAAFSQLGPIGGIASYFLDGGNSYYTKVLVDGTPVNEPGGAVDFSNYTLDGIDKIEIMHGAASALYGSDAMTGVVQIFTHRGTTSTPQLILLGEGGTFDSGRGAAQLSGLTGPFDYSLMAGYIKTNGQGPGDQFRDTTLSGNFGWKFSDTDMLRLTARNSASGAGQPGQTLLPGGSEIGQNSDLQDFSAGLAWNFQIGNHWQEQATGYESHFQDEEFSPTFGSFTSKFNRAGLTEQTSYVFHNGEVTAGYMFEVENGPEHRVNQAGYAEVRYNVGKRLTTIAGARVEANGFFGTRWVPRLGASYALRYGQGFWGDTRLRASYGKGIVEPEMFPAGCTPILDPEQSTTVQAGVDQVMANDRLRLSVTYFHNSFHDIVSFISTDVNPNCPAFGGSFFNTDLARAWGANTSFDAKVTRWLRIEGNYSYDDSKVISAPNATDPALVAGNRLFLRPLHAANLAATTHFWRMSWSMAGQYVGRRADSDFLGLTPAITSTPAWVRWDLWNSIDMGHRVTLLGRVDNLFNNHYQTAVGYPALRLNWRLGVRYVLGGE
jgi:vitamin B12 transporter